MSDTLTGPASAEQTIQKSRFLVRAWPIIDSADALALVEQCARDEASHHCWAYRFGDQYRWSDANEPAGSAGRPILQAIDGQGFDRVLAVVTRWFGGIKLGVGGLVRAYGGCAADCLRNAPRQPLIATQRLAVAVPFASESALRQLLHELDGRLSADAYAADGYTAVIELPATNADALTQRLRDLTRGQASLRRLPT